ncbi:hypothetical protein AQUCO_01400942v1 [Aquilegia coerulea]|uniref:Uncharacterized protein n=1 Tax=Aquilegia coerulea TaxID=218851 RepID=A0A2G5DYX6_AQUCA|nr:hypothetical protein AQUCO_01400942v1 [Aquilegia coerulea]
MEFPYGHHRRHDYEEENQDYPPNFHNNNQSPPPNFPGGYARDQPSPPNFHHIHNQNQPPPTFPGGFRDESYSQSPPPPPPPFSSSVTHHQHMPAHPNPNRSDYYGGVGEIGGGYQPQPPPPSIHYQGPPPPVVQHVSHHSDDQPEFPHDRDRHPHQHHSGGGGGGGHSNFLPSFTHHHNTSHEPSAAAGSGYGNPGDELLLHKPTVRVYSKADTGYSLSIRDAQVVLAPSNPRDDFQHWIKDQKFSTKVKDEEGFPCFALVNKATGQALKHSIGATQPVILSFSLSLFIYLFTAYIQTTCYPSLSLPLLFIYYFRLFCCPS